MKNIWPKIYIQNIKYLNLSNNKIRNIFYFVNNKACCFLEGFEKLEYLNISKNPIKETNPANLESLKNLKTLNISQILIDKEHYLRFIKKLNFLESLIIKSHKMYNLNIKGVINQIGSKKNLIELDFRIIKDKNQVISEKDAKLIFANFPKLKKFNSTMINEVHKKNEKSAQHIPHNKTPCNKKYLDKINVKIKKSPFKKLDKSNNKIIVKKLREKSISNMSKSDFKMYDSDDSYIGKKSKNDFNNSFDNDNKKEDDDKKTMRNFLTIFHQKLELADKSCDKENSDQNQRQKKAIEKYKKFFSNDFNV
jgi:hypothetical protein